MQIIPAYFLWIQQGLFIRHRTLIYSILRVLHMLSGDLHSFFWAADADLTRPEQFYMMAFCNGGNLLVLLFW